MADTVEARATHRFTASPERVFDAWLNPGHCPLRWMGGALKGSRLRRDMRRVEIDGRVGDASPSLIRGRPARRSTGAPTGNRSPQEARLHLVHERPGGTGELVRRDGHGETRWRRMCCHTHPSR